MGRKEECKGKLEVATISDSSFGQGNYILSGRSQGILKSDVFGKHVSTRVQAGTPKK